jgi:hypothetical protein
MEGLIGRQLASFFVDYFGFGSGAPAPQHFLPARPQAQPAATLQQKKQTAKEEQLRSYFRYPESSSPAGASLSNFFYFKLN